MAAFNFLEFKMASNDPRFLGTPEYWSLFNNKMPTKEYKYGDPNPNPTTANPKSNTSNSEYLPYYPYYKSISFMPELPKEPNPADTYANLFNAFKQKAIQENIILDHEDLCFLFKTDPGYINQIYYKNNADKIVLESLEELIEIVKKYANP